MKDDLSFSLPSSDKITDKCPNSIVILLDNKKLSSFLSQRSEDKNVEEKTSATPFEIFSRVSSVWKRELPSQMIVAGGPKGLTLLRETFFTLFQQQAQRTLVDFDDHFDDITMDYLNPALKSLGKAALPGQLR